MGAVRTILLSPTNEMHFSNRQLFFSGRAPSCSSVLVFCFDNILGSTARLNSCRPNYFSGLSRHLTLYSRDVTEDSEESIELNVSLEP